MAAQDRTAAPASGLSRRHFFGGAAVVSAGIALGAPPAPAAAAPASPADTTIPVTLTVNGTTRTLRIDSRVTLLDALRERLDLTGSKRVATGDSAAPARCTSTAGGCCPA